MKQLGRVHWMVLVGIFGIVVLGVIVYLGGSTPPAVANDFFLALAKGDVDRLTNLTYLGDDSKEHLKKEWEFATRVAAPHYRFTWNIKSYVEQGPNNASVRAEVVRNCNQPGSFPEYLELPMIKEGGQWKVRVTALSRELYPSLPR